mgnify:CR=1 FL=1
MKLFLIIFIFLTSVFAKEPKTLTCFIAKGFPPFQFEDEKNVVRGIDVEIAKLFNKYNTEGIKVELRAMKWSDAIGTLLYTNRGDCIWGMEITKKRVKLFEMTMPLYERVSTLFVLKKSDYKSIDELQNKIIGDDKDSDMSNYLKSKDLRVAVVKTKEESFKSLMSGKFAAISAPYRVGIYLSKKLKTPIRVLKKHKKGRGVSVATKSEDIRKLIESGLKEIPKHELDKALKSY